MQIHAAADDPVDIEAQRAILSQSGLIDIFRALAVVMGRADYPVARNAAAALHLLGCPAETQAITDSEGCSGLGAQ
nr:hypothetical protein [Nocardia brasiliensis]